MPRNTRLPEYQAFIDATEQLKNDNVDFIKYDNYVIIKRDIWEKSIKRTKQVLNERKLAEEAVYSNKFN